MELGPLEYLVIEFPGNKFSGEIGPALKACVDKGAIRVIDITFIMRDSDDSITALELEELDPDAKGIFAPFVSEVTEMLSQEDILAIAETLQPNSSAAIMLYEDTWAIELRDALVRADGRFIGGGFIPRDAVDATLDWLEHKDD